MFTKNKPIIETPWGVAQSIDEVAEGITFYSTASHGGYKISTDRNETMPEPYKSHKTFAGDLWYEEDCDWCCIALSFPDEFTQGMTEERKQECLKKAAQTWEWMQRDKR
jgi:hypothetical protein